MAVRCDGAGAGADLSRWGRVRRCTQRAALVAMVDELGRLGFIDGQKPHDRMAGSLEDVIDGDVPLGEVYELGASFRGRIDAFVKTIDTRYGAHER